MQFLNYDFYNSSNMLNYIYASIQVLINKDYRILETKEFFLFFYIRKDFEANLRTLYGYDIEEDILGFPVIQRNTRHAIEAFLDLVNLSRDIDYLSVMEYCAKKSKGCYYHEKYHQILKGSCNIYKKYKIATEMYGESISQNLLDISSKTNSYTHPNVFINILAANDYNKKYEILRNLLNVCLYTLTSAYKILLKKFNNDIVPDLNCIPCRLGCFKNCFQCFTDEVNKFYNLINNSWVITTIPLQNPYYN